MTQVAPAEAAKQDAGVAEIGGNAAGYEVGYRKPPKKTQFKKGQSGNPRGVPKPMTMAQTMAALMARPATIIEKGKRRRTTMQDALMQSVLKKGLQGDNKAVKLITTLVGEVPVAPVGLTPEEHAAAFQEATQGFTLEQLETLQIFCVRMEIITDRVVKTRSKT